MAGALGIGGDLSRWTQQEMEEARDFIAMYKRVRLIIQNGLLYRLRSPRAGSFAAVQYVARDGSEIVVFVWGHSQQFGETQVTLSLPGLEEEACYTDAVSGTTYRGSYLAHHGLPVSLVGDFDSHMVHLVRQASTR
jgi:alpha-galactosidase